MTRHVNEQAGWERSRGERIQAGEPLLTWLVDKQKPANPPCSHCLLLSKFFHIQVVLVSDNAVFFRLFFLSSKVCGQAAAANLR